MEQAARMFMRAGPLVISVFVFFALSGCEFAPIRPASEGVVAQRGTWDLNNSAYPGAGYYDGITATVGPGDICVGKSIFGTSGVAVCQSGNPSSVASSGEILSGYEVWNAGPALLTGTMVNRGVFNAAVPFPGQGYYNGALANMPASTHLVLGHQVLGVRGTVSAFATLTSSNVFRTAGTAAFPLNNETTTYSGVTFPSGYREIPKVATDNDGTNGGSVIKVNRAGFIDCGTVVATLTAKIGHCAANNGADATWDGTSKGNSGQGVWYLVSRSGAGNEVWKDGRTGLLWSSLISTSINFCHASGMNYSTAVTDPNVKSNDEGNQCNTAGNVNNGPPESACVEHPEFAATYLNAVGKLGLKLASTPAVRWRLPTINDYRQAEVNGIRFVIPDPVVAEWSASITVSGSSLYFDSITGKINASSRLTMFGARCVGR